MLARDPRLADYQKFASFITNRFRSCALWSQRAAKPAEPVVWDYHVILFVVLGQKTWVYDLDSRLPFPCSLKDYARGSFPFQRDITVHYQPFFRVVPVPLFLERFASDRSHMRNGDEWLSPPPPWPCIVTADEKMTLPRFLDLQPPVVSPSADPVGLPADDHNELGAVMSLAELLAIHGG